jgi:hypothetical protein
VPYVPGFAHDVFVSYAHGPKPLAGFRGMRSDFISKWTQSLVDDLSSQLDVFLGTKDQKRRVSIWMDPGQTFARGSTRPDSRSCLPPAMTRSMKPR